MSKVTKPALLDETGQQIVEKLHTQNLLLNVLANSAIEGATSLDEIHRIVKSGNAAKVFNIGDQIIVPWTDKAANKTYQVPLDIVHFANVELQDGESVPAMFLQWHYCTPFGVQFDAREAFHVAPSGGYAAGSTFHFNVPTAWDSTGTGDFKFACNKAIPKGAHFVFATDISSAGLNRATVKVYANGSSDTEIDSFTISNGSTGTYDLGKLQDTGDKSLNGIHTAVYGFNRWSKSALRQFLNSKANPDAWWTSQHSYDRKPAELATKYGFMSGFEDEFLATLQPIKVSTVFNAVNGDGGLEDTYDTFFPPCLQNMNINKQYEEDEGDVFNYWKRVSQSSSKLTLGGTYPQLKTYGIDNTNTAQNVRLRSICLGKTFYTWYVYSSGNVGCDSATLSGRCAPVCAMC